MKTGFLQLRHVSFQGQPFATAIPRKHYVQVYVHKYQDILQRDPGDLSYPEYFDWLDHNDYTEDCRGLHETTIRDEYYQTPQTHQNDPEHPLIDHPDQMDIFQINEN